MVMKYSDGVQGTARFLIDGHRKFKKFTVEKFLGNGNLDQPTKEEFEI
jgi:hypothetical protein